MKKIYTLDRRRRDKHGALIIEIKEVKDDKLKPRDSVVVKRHIISTPQGPGFGLKKVKR